MSNITTILHELKQTLISSNKEKILCLFTTSDITNPSFILGSSKETDTTIAGTILVRDESHIDEIISLFDGGIDYFLVDCEIKNELKNLETLVFEKVKKSKVLVCKPNDFTVESLDICITLLVGSLLGKKVSIIGMGNIGSKSALKLCERGADVFVFSKDKNKTNSIITGLNLIKKSNSSIRIANTPEEATFQADLILGCAPGVPVITKQMVEQMNQKGIIIDVGNRTIAPDALLVARKRGIEVRTLSGLGGYKGMIENWLYQRSLFEGGRQKSFGSWSMITPGVLGLKGDVLVDTIDIPSRVFGVCDGVGGLLSKDEGKKIIERYLANAGEISSINIISALYQ